MAFVPGRYLIDAYGSGGFRFADMSHQGSILVLPSGICGWPVQNVEDMDEAAFAPVLAEAGNFRHLLIGAGHKIRSPRKSALEALRAAGLNVEILQTGAAARTYNILMAENRMVAAALLAV